MNSSKDLKNNQAVTLHYGPLNKNIATCDLDDIIQRMFNGEYQYEFSIKHDERQLVLVPTEQKSNSSASTKTYYLTSLMKSANLQHIRRLDTDLLKKCNERLKKIGSSSHPIMDVPDKITAPFETKITSLKKQIDELKKIEPQDPSKIKQAEEEIKEIENEMEHLLAAYEYTKYMGVNPFLRNSFISSLFSTERLFIVTMIMADYINRYQTELELDERTDNTLSQPETKHVKSIDTIRTEIHESGNPTLTAFSTQTRFIIRDPAFTSVSKGSLVFVNLDKKSMSELNTIAGLNPNKLVVIYKFKNEADKDISAISYIPDQKEIVLNPGAKAMSVYKAGNLVFIIATLVDPLESEPRDYSMAQFALRAAYDKYYSKPYPDKQREDEAAHEIKFKLDEKDVAIVRPNHGLPHAARQMALVPHIIQSLIQDAKSDEIKELCKQLQFSGLLVLLQTAAAFLSVGRTNELSHEADKDSYAKARQNDKAYFEQFLQDNYPFLMTKNDKETKEEIEEYERIAGYLREFVPLCADAVLNLGNPDHMIKLGENYRNATTKNKRQALLALIIFHILNAVHILDVQRCLSKVSKEMTVSELLKDRICHSDAGLFDTNEDIDKVLAHWWNISAEMLDATGEQNVPLNKGRYKHTFYECSTSPRTVEGKLNLFQQPLFSNIPQEIKDETERNALVFEYLSYLSKLGALKLDKIAEDTKLGKMLVWAYQHIEDKKLDGTENKNTDDFVNKIVATYKKLGDENIKKILNGPDKFECIPEGTSIAIYRLQAIVDKLTKNEEQTHLVNALNKLKENDPDIFYKPELIDMLNLSDKPYNIANRIAWLQEQKFPFDEVIKLKSEEYKKLLTYPLFFDAVETGDVDAVKYWLTQIHIKIDINELNIKDFAALHLAIWNRDTEMVKVLLEQKEIDLYKVGKYPNRGRGDMRPLTLAAFDCPNVEILSLLLKKGLKANSEDDKYLISDILVCKLFRIGNPIIDIIKLLLDYQICEIDCKCFGETLLAEAIHSRHDAKLISFLIERGADVNQQTRNRGNLLHLAASAFHEEFDDNLDVIRILIDKGLDLNLVDEDSRTPLRRATEYFDNKSLVKLLCAQSQMYFDYIKNDKLIEQKPQKIIEEGVHEWASGSKDLNDPLLSSIAKHFNANKDSESETKKSSSSLSIFANPKSFADILCAHILIDKTKNKTDVSAFLNEILNNVNNSKKLSSEFREILAKHNPITQQKQFNNQISVSNQLQLSV